MSALPLPTMASAAVTTGGPAAGPTAEPAEASAAAPAAPTPTLPVVPATTAIAPTAAAQSSSVLPAASSVDLSVHRSGIVPAIQNIVATVNLDCKLNLQQIATQARNAEFRPTRFAAVIMRLREPRTTALIFASGKMVCTGAKSEEASRTAARKYARIIQKLGFKVTFKDFKIQNMVGSCDVKFPIRLEGLHYNQQPFSKYEPEMFSGLMYRLVEPKVVLLIFVSGKVIITGAKTRQQIYEAFEAIYPVLTEYRKT
mmetsp:Transcript_28267/g.74153  ORF Transcript_28267/g.74153 Transcript_28267/m.74153 type:complete len:256 (+) Transcript_28267:249-1016(+)